ncbi:hypothetical protein IPJ91_00400 [bacterium]|nr:MAG: hypothetical protein IPJ91_00400 [bacterium]
MDQNKFSKFLQGSDLRTLGESQEILNLDISQADFDKLVDLLNSKKKICKDESD